MNKQRKLVPALAMALAVLPLTASASEGGKTAYPNGAEDFMVGAVPPPGNYLINYLLNYNANDFNNSSGNNIIPGFDLNAWADVLRFIHVSDYQVLGGNWVWHVFLPLVHVDVTVPPPFGPGDGSKGGIGDIIFSPFVVSWHHSKNLHSVMSLVDVYAPTGSYDQYRLANIGLNYWTFEPVYAVSYISDEGWEASVKLMYDFNLENPDTNYKSGQAFHFDYTFAKHFPGWALGVGGYYYTQTTDDSGPTAPPDGFKGKAFAVGPQVMFDVGKVKAIFKYQWETDTENQPQGNKFWFKLIVPL